MVQQNPVSPAVNQTTSSGSNCQIKSVSDGAVFVTLIVVPQPNT